MSVMMNPKGPPESRRNDRDDLEAKRDKAETAYFEDALEVSAMTNALHMREGIIRP